MPTARGSFTVHIKPDPPYLDQDGIKLNRNFVSKEYSGDLIGVAEAQMLAAYANTPGSAGYVAIERFTGSIGERQGSFVLQHHGIMNKGDAQLTVTIVPDSGTGKLSGISGALQIDIHEGQHSYTLTYSLH